MLRRIPPFVSLASATTSGSRRPMITQTQHIPQTLRTRSTQTLPSARSRSIHSSTNQSIRQSYYDKPLSARRSTIIPPNGSGNSFRNNGYGGGGGGRGGPNWFSSFRARIDGIRGDYLIYGMIGVNVGVYGLWQYANTSWQRFRDPTLYYWLSRNMVVSEMNLAAGRIHTLLTSCFSHSTGSHILVNMLGLYFVGPTVVGFLGNSAFLGLYFAGGVISSAVSLTWHYLRDGRDTRARKAGHEGASGAIYASLAYYAAMFPQSKVYLFMIVPVPAWIAVGGIFAYDLFSSIRSPFSTTDSAGHVGGILAGVGLALASRGRMRGPRVPWR